MGTDMTYESNGSHIWAYVVTLGIEHPIYSLRWVFLTRILRPRQGEYRDYYFPVIGGILFFIYADLRGVRQLIICFCRGISLAG